MGNLCSSCCKESSSYEDLTPDLETRRRQQVAAAEKRIAEQNNRGIKNVDAVKRQERLDQQRDQRQAEAANTSTQAQLKWQVN